jgi:hypothetical protein
MVDRLIYLRKALDTLRADNQCGDSPILDDDWTKLEAIKQVLDPFKKSQEILEGDNYFSASVVVIALNDIRKT